MHLVVMMDIVSQYITELNRKVPLVTLVQKDPLTLHHLYYILLPHLSQLVGYLLCPALSPYACALQLNQTLHVLLSFQHIC